MFPIIGLGAAMLTAIGGYGLYWYHNLTDSEKERADRAAWDYAKSIYGKNLHDLTQDQLKHVHSIVKEEFAA